MKVELPVFKRCCCCIPLRHGLLAWGYIKLVALFAALVIWSKFSDPALSDTVIIVTSSGYLLGILLLPTAAWAIIVLTDIALTIVFVVGGHRKSAILLRVFYIYCVVVFCIMVVMNIAFFGYNMYVRAHDGWANIFSELPDVAVAITEIGIKAYGILLIRSEIIKLQNNCNEAKYAMDNGTITNKNGSAADTAIVTGNFFPEN